MCVVSNIGDTYRDDKSWPWSPTLPSLPPKTVPQPFRDDWMKEIAKAKELDDLRKRVAILEELLRKGKEFDAQTGQPDCELEEKKQALVEIAKKLGVEINFPG